MPLKLRVERRSSGDSRSETAYYGPCFVCEQETRYIGFSHEHDADEWLKKQFRPKQRDRHLETLHTGKFQIYGQYVLSTLEGFVCAICKAQCEESRKKERKEQKQAEERKKRALEREEWLRMWRAPEPNEFDRTTVRRAFSAFSREGQIASLLFRARVCPEQQCRGNSPAHRVGVWADGKLLAHYYGWELGGIKVEGYSDRDGESDLFGPGLARWVEKQFQSVLISMEPDVVWNARSRVFGRREDSHWDGWDKVSDIGCEGPLEPSLIHTISAEKSIYASLRNFYTLADVAEFAAQHLRIEIRESWMTRKLR